MALEAQGDLGDEPYEFSRWKIILLGGALTMVVLGGIVRWFEGAGDAPRSKESAVAVTVPLDHQKEDQGVTVPPGSSLVEGVPLPPGLPPPSGPEDDDAEVSSEWSGGLFRGGFGFFVGFCIGYAMRVFVRLATIVIGVNLLVTLFLSYLGWVDIRWDVMQIQGDQILDNLGHEFSSFKSFLVGKIPSATLAGLGLFAGLRKK